MPHLAPDPEPWHLTTDPAEGPPNGPAILVAHQYPGGQPFTAYYQVVTHWPNLLHQGAYAWKYAKPPNPPSPEDVNQSS